MSRPQLRGRVVAVVATGPSLTPSVRSVLQRARSSGRCLLLAANNAALDLPGVDWLHTNDTAWASHHADRVRAFGGYKTSLFPVAGLSFDSLYESSGAQGYDPTPGRLRHGGNSGLSACHIAAQEGARRLVLFGFDLRGSHYFGFHPKPLRNTTEATFASFLRRFRVFAGELSLVRPELEVLIASPGSALSEPDPGLWPSVDPLDIEAWAE